MILWSLALVALVLPCVLVVRPTVLGYTQWFFAVPNARLTADNAKADGWLHRGHHGQAIILTRKDGVKWEIVLDRARRRTLRRLGGATASSVCG
jgi:hypothetical protein